MTKKKNPSRNHKVVQKNSNTQIKVNHQNETIKREELISIYAEAYYQALKRIEKEKKPKQECRKYKWNENVGFFLNLLLFPWIIRKKYKIKNNVYDNLIVLVISWLLYIMGTVLWVASIVGILIFIYGIIKGIEILSVLSTFVVIYFLFFGSIMIVSAKQFSEEQDFNRIYVFSTIIIAMVSCVISVIALMQ